MKLQELFDKSNPVLLEHLGNLSALGMPNLLNILRQTRFEQQKSKFYSTYGFRGIGANSLIKDYGKVKNLADIRKAFKNAEVAQAFALYIDNKPVMFCKTDEHNLAGSSRENLVAYNLSAFKDKIRNAEDEEHAKKPNSGSGPYRSPLTSISTNNSWEVNELLRNLKIDKDDFGSDKKKALGLLNSEIEAGKQEAGRYNRFKKADALRVLLAKNGYNWPELKQIDIELKRALKDDLYRPVGRSYTTSQLKELINHFAEIGTLTIKFVLADPEGYDKAERRREFSPQAVIDFKADLEKRLQNFKNSKTPTVNSVKEFIEMVERSPEGIKTVQLDGRAFSIVEKTASTINGISLLAGAPFTITYKSAVKNDYHGLEITYVYMQDTRTIEVVEARYNTYDSNGAFISKTVVVNNKAWLKNHQLSTENKEATIKALLQIVKNTRKAEMPMVINAVKALRDEGINWPELEVIIQAAEKIRVEGEKA